MGRASRLLSRQQRLVPLLVIAALTTSCAQAAKPDGALPAASPTAPAADVRQVSLERTPCFGACATFTLQVATTDGQASLSLPGKRAAKMASEGPGAPIILKGQVPAAQVQQLADTLRDGGFASLEADYSANISDMPGTVITVTTAGGTASTRVYGVPCAGQVSAADGIDPALGLAKPVPDVFCQAARQLDAMACAVYAHGKDTLPAGVEARFPPRCDDGA